MKKTKIFIVMDREINGRLFKFGEILDGEEKTNCYRIVERNITFFIPKEIAQKIHASIFYP